MDWSKRKTCGIKKVGWGLQIKMEMFITDLIYQILIILFLFVLVFYVFSLVSVLENFKNKQKKKRFIISLSIYGIYLMLLMFGNISLQLYSDNYMSSYCEELGFEEIVITNNNNPPFYGDTTFYCKTEIYSNKGELIKTNNSNIFRFDKIYNLN